MKTEQKHIEKYIDLNGKTVTNKELNAQLIDLQKSIESGKINSKSPFLKQINRIQDSLIYLVNLNQTVLVEIEPMSLLFYKMALITTSERKAKQIMSDFIYLQGKTDKKKANSLLENLNVLLKDTELKNRDKYLSMHAILTRFLSGKTKAVETPDIMLNGLAGLAGIEIPKTNFQSGKPVPITDFARSSFNVIQFDGKFGKLIGNPQLPMKLMFYGQPGGGKSSLALQFAHYMVTQHGQKALFISKEEGFNYTIKEKAQRLNCVHPNIHLVDKIPANMQGYDIIFLDSVKTLQLSPIELRNLYDKYPKTSFVGIFQTTKEGMFRGEKEFEHDVDAVFRVNNLVATPEKNRFGGKESVKVL